MGSLLKYSLTFILFLICTSIQTEAKRIVVHSVEDFLKTENYNGITFVVKKNLDLRGSHIVLPENSCIIFKRKGCLRNGLVQGSHSRIVYKEGNNIFCDCVIKGKWEVQSANSLMFDNTMETLLLLRNLSSLSSYVKLFANRDYNIVANGDYLELETIEAFGKEKPRICFHTTNPNVNGINLVGDNVILRNLIITDDYNTINDEKYGYNDYKNGSTVGLFSKGESVESLLIESCDFCGGTSSSFVASSHVRNCIVRECSFSGYIGDHAVYCSVNVESFYIQNCAINDIEHSKGLFKVRSSDKLKRIKLNNLKVHNINGYLGIFSLTKTPELEIELDNITVSKDDNKDYYFCGFCITDDTGLLPDRSYNAKRLFINNCAFSYGYKGNPLVYHGSGQDAKIKSIIYYNTVFCNSHFGGAISDELKVSKCICNLYYVIQGIFMNTKILSIDNTRIAQDFFCSSIFQLNYGNNRMEMVDLKDVVINANSTFLFLINDGDKLVFNIEECDVKTLSENIFKAPSFCDIQYNITKSTIKANDPFKTIFRF